MLGRPVPLTVDVVVALGSHDERVAVRAAELVGEGHAGLLVATGGYGRITSITNTEPEAHVFRRVAIAHGVAPEAVLVEDRASNTLENITRTRALLEARGVVPASGILACKPYMERRALATAQRQWPAVAWTVTSPHATFATHATDGPAFTLMVSLMVGDLQRIAVYGERGHLVPQDIPMPVRRAFDALVQGGHDRFLLACP